MRVFDARPTQSKRVGASSTPCPDMQSLIIAQFGMSLTKPVHTNPLGGFDHIRRPAHSLNRRQRLPHWFKRCLTAKRCSSRIGPAPSARRPYCKALFAPQRSTSAVMSTQTVQDQCYPLFRCQGRYPDHLIAKSSVVCSQPMFTKYAPCVVVQAHPVHLWRQAVQDEDGRVAAPSTRRDNRRSRTRRSRYDPSARRPPALRSPFLEPPAVP